MIQSINRTVCNALASVNSSYSGRLFACPKCGNTGNPYDGFCRECGYLLPKEQMMKRADELLTRDLRLKTPHPIIGLAYLPGVGRIDLEIGHKGVGSAMERGSGLSKLLQKHEKLLKYLPATLVLGKPCDSKEEGKIARYKDNLRTIIGKRPYGGTVVTIRKIKK